MAGRDLGIRVDQTLTQDATGTLVMLELEAMGLDRVRTEVSAQYLDHTLIQEDFKTPDAPLFLRSACRRFGIWYNPPANGVSHPVHQERFGKPGKTLLGSDSHTPDSWGYRYARDRCRRARGGSRHGRRAVSLQDA